MSKLNWIADRLGENSTWRGLIGLLTASGVIIRPDVAEKIIAAGIAIVALINIFRKAPPSAADVAHAVNTGDTQHLTRPETKPETKPEV